MKNRRRKAYVIVGVVGGLAALLSLAPISRGTHNEKPLGYSMARADGLVEGTGKVIAVTREKQELVLEHGEIKGFMDAMTMGYKVSSASLLKGLKPGDAVRFSIDPHKSTIVKISKLGK